MIKLGLLRQRLRAQLRREMHLLISLLYLVALIMCATMLSMWSVYQ